MNLKNQICIDIIKRTKINTDYIYNEEKLLNEKIKFLADYCENVLDFGKSSRNRYSFFDINKIITSDINSFDDYPDVIDDICNIKNLKFDSFDGIICLAILEHVYSPHQAVENMYKLLKKDGYCFVYAPFILKYHAPENLKFQDYFRYSKDGLAYLFKDFSEVTIFPFRGRYSTIFNLFGFWKNTVEKNCGQRINKIIDRFFKLFLNKNDILYASGYYLWAKK